MILKMMDSLSDNTMILSQDGLLHSALDNSTLVVFDQRVQDLNLLYQALLPGTIAYAINTTENALTVITHLLATTGAKRLAIIAHGEPGIVHIGATPLDLEQLQRHLHLL